MKISTILSLVLASTFFSYAQTSTMKLLLSEEGALDEYTYYARDFNMSFYRSKLPSKVNEKDKSNEEKKSPVHETHADLSFTLIGGIDNFLLNLIGDPAKKANGTFTLDNTKTKKMDTYKLTGIRINNFSSSSYYDESMGSNNSSFYVSIFAEKIVLNGVELKQ